MTKDELYSKMAAMLPVENTDSKPFRILLSDSLKTYLSYVNKTEGIGDEDKKEIAYICEAIKAIVKAQYKGLHAQAFRKLSNLFSGKTGHKGFGNILFVSQLGANNSFYRARVHSGTKSLPIRICFIYLSQNEELFKLNAIVSLAILVCMLEKASMLVGKKCIV